MAYNYNYTELAHLKSLYLTSICKIEQFFLFIFISTYKLFTICLPELVYTLEFVCNSEQNRHERSNMIHIRSILAVHTKKRSLEHVETFNFSPLHNLYTTPDRFNQIDQCEWSSDSSFVSCFVSHNVYYTHATAAITHNLIYWELFR